MKNSELHSFYLEDWLILPDEGVVTLENETTRLEPKAMEVLVYLAAHPGEVISRDKLENDVWHGALVGYDSVTSTINKLRKAFHDDARQPKYIATIPKKGYQLVARLSLPSDKNKKLSDNKQIKFPSRMNWFFVSVASIFIAIMFWVSLQSHDADKLINKYSIVILPFDNLTNNKKQQYLAEGLTDDIITHLSGLSSLLVIASHSSSQYKGMKVTPEQIRNELNVEYVLKGNIRVINSDIRVTVQLINTNTGLVKWAKHYDSTISNVFDIEDEVAQSVVKALSVNMTNKEKQHLTTTATNSLQAYDLFQEGQRIVKGGTKEANEQARRVFRQVIELDPNYGRAYGALAITLAKDYRWRFTNSPIATLNRALELAKKGVELDNTSPHTYWALGFVNFISKDYAKAEEAATQSIRIAPNYADGYGLLALIKNSIGEPEKALTLNSKGIQLNPYYTWEYLYNIGVAKYMLGNYKEAIVALEKAQARNDNIVSVKLYLIASYVRAGRQEDAQWTVEQLQVQTPMATITDVEKTIPIALPEYKTSFINDLYKAGLVK